MPKKTKPTDVLGKAARIREQLQIANRIIEIGDNRLLACDGPVGDQPPDVSLDEWRRLYKAVNGALRMTNDLNYQLRRQVTDGQ